MIQFDLVNTNSINLIVVKGVSLGGFAINVHPDASAGATFRVSIAAGKFQGVIPTTKPTGTLFIIIFLSLLLLGTVRP